MRNSIYNANGQLVEVVADDVATFRLEKMVNGDFWIGLRHADGSVTQVNIFSRSGGTTLDAKCKFEFVQIQENDDG